MRRALGATLLAALLGLPGAALGDRRADLEALREAIGESRERVSVYEREQRGLLETVEALDRAAALLASDVERARREAEEAGAELVRLEAEQAEHAERLALTRRAMRARAVALYRAGELGAVRLLFSSGGLPQFLTRVSSLRRLLGHDAELLVRHRRQTEALAAAELRARASAERFAEARRELEERSAELEVERARKVRLVALMRADRTRERAALVELEKAAQALEETLANLGSEPAPVERQLPGPPFVAQRRRLEPPVRAPLVRGFGREVEPEFLTETFHSGVVFAAPRGTPVAAVAAGSVRFAGWFRGYGNLVILDHGGGYFSVSGHLEEIVVERDELVPARETIGRVGETGSLAGPRLYFEIRRGSEALDPVDWLRGGGAS